MGGEAPLRPAGAAYALLSHEPGHLVATNLEAMTLRGLGELALAVDGIVLLPDGFEGRAQFRVAHFSLRGFTILDVVVGGRGDLELLADRLDPPPSAPTSLLLPVGVDESNYF